MAYLVAQILRQPQTFCRLRRKSGPSKTNRGEENEVNLELTQIRAVGHALLLQTKETICEPHKPTFIVARSSKETNGFKVRLSGIVPILVFARDGEIFCRLAALLKNDAEGMKSPCIIWISTCRI